MSAAIVNAVVGLLATGGSTNHTLHLVAIARAAGIIIDWDDFSDLSDVVPLLARIYPNGGADVNHFHAAGGMGFLVASCWAPASCTRTCRPSPAPACAPRRSSPGSRRRPGLARGCRRELRHQRPAARHRSVQRRRRPQATARQSRPRRDQDFGRRLPPPGHRSARPGLRRPGRRAGGFQRGELERDVVVVVRFQGPRANGMPELHKLTPALASLQSKGHQVALVTDGRMSGASGKVPAAIHVTPEAASGGPLGKVRDGDIIRLDSVKGTLEALVPEESLEPTADSHRGPDRQRLRDGARALPRLSRQRRPRRGRRRHSDGAAQSCAVRKQLSKRARAAPWPARSNESYGWPPKSPQATFGQSVRAGPTSAARSARYPIGIATAPAPPARSAPAIAWSCSADLAQGLHQLLREIVGHARRVGP